MLILIQEVIWSLKIAFIYLKSNFGIIDDANN